MTEAEWLACNDPRPMLTSLRDRASDRKLRLFACACCRRIWHLLTDGRSRTAVTVAEQFSEGAVTAQQLLEAELAAQAGAEGAYFAIREEAAAKAAAEGLPEDWVY